MTDLRTAAQQALEAMSSFENGTGGLYEGEFSAEIAALRAALAEPVQPETVDQRVVPLVESALQAVAEKIGDQCAVWYGIGARDVEEVLREAARYGLVHGAPAEPVQEPVAGRAFLERILTAMEGVIDVADRKTDEFDALRSCVIDLTLMLHTAPPQRKPLSAVDLRALYDQHAACQEEGPETSGWWDFARAIERAHGIA